ncbi:hypothetical protein K1T71_008087 [Dendrolimus kikuchii]|uniref:Uncharacterized protein n=1 Tax=Dendrolimus kikuchii TaxID=765133 RepID=A0ACC1CW85_9NEOP|nr:hypothetical protein K1T71_008087 [Dendrolimus kikuchii]
MVNGTWTEDHINELWGVPFTTYRVYPPCEVSQLKQLRSLVKESDPILILSVAQFRPEKDHPLMLQAMYELRNLLVKNEMLWNKVKIKLTLADRVRNTEVRKRVGLKESRFWCLNLNFYQSFVDPSPHAPMLQFEPLASPQPLYSTPAAIENTHFGIALPSANLDILKSSPASGGNLCGPSPLPAFWSRETSINRFDKSQYKKSIALKKT